MANNQSQQDKIKRLVRKLGSDAEKLATILEEDMAAEKPFLGDVDYEQIGNLLQLATVAEILTLPKKQVVTILQQHHKNAQILINKLDKPKILGI